MDTLTMYAARGAIVRGDKGFAVQLAQTLLNSAGSCLVTDGVFGNATEDAVRAFQARSGIAQSGRIGTTTASALEVSRPPIASPINTITSVKSQAPWLTTMRAITGHKEYPGDANSPFILGMAAEIAERYPQMAKYCKSYTRDAIPWCGLAMAYVMAVNDIEPVFDVSAATRSFLWAAAWKLSGVHCSPCVGAIGVFTREGGGHVALIEGWANDRYIVRGGNQTDMINVTTIPKERLTDTRWPFNWPIVSSLAGQTSSQVTSGSLA